MQLLWRDWAGQSSQVQDQSICTVHVFASGTNTQVRTWRKWAPWCSFSRMVHKFALEFVSRCTFTRRATNTLLHRLMSKGSYRQLAIFSVPASWSEQVVYFGLYLNRFKSHISINFRNFLELFFFLLELYFFSKIEKEISQSSKNDLKSLFACSGSFSGSFLRHWNRRKFRTGKNFVLRHCWTFVRYWLSNCKNGVTYTGMHARFSRTIQFHTLSKKYEKTKLNRVQNFLRIHYWFRSKLPY